ncbi:alginate export family protein [Parapedobacter tibetensis]|uniref:alginate export family protein n=1 Tax=Parapedobacter tibetensis TaxID=2972951 RepID=UPI00214D594F|nr:alginate export family protein [Parapedobacter tibetensis]
MNVFLRNFLILAFFQSAFATQSFGQLTISGEIRPRVEFRNGFKTLHTTEQKPAFFTEQRSRLNVHFQEEKLTFRLSAQDVRVWGSTNQIYKTDSSLFNMFEAWGAYAISPTLAIKVGRQTLDYDNARFLGDLDWAQQGRSHDAALLTYDDSLGTKIHVGAGYNQNVPFEPSKLSGTLYEGMDNYKTMQFIWLHRTFERSFLSLLVFNDGRQNPDPEAASKKVNFRQTVGFTGQKQLNKINLDGELYYQGGRDPLGLKTAAWLASASMTYKTSLTPIVLGADYLTGSEPGSNTNRAFNPLYGTNHKFYGFMDHFYVGNNHGQSGATAGLKDFFLKTNFKLSGTTSLLAHVHHFESAVPIHDPSQPAERMSRSLGEEVDLVLTAKLAKTVTLNIGYSQLFRTESAEVLKGKQDTPAYQGWAWTMIRFNPTLFASK